MSDFSQALLDRKGMSSHWSLNRLDTDRDSHTFRTPIRPPVSSHPILHPVCIHTRVSVYVSPSRHHTHVPGLGAGCGQGDGLDKLVESDRVGQLQQHNVVVQGLVVIALELVDGVHRQR